MNSKYTHLSISLLCKIGINILVVFYVASQLSIQDFGSFSLAFVFSALFISIFDYGLNLKSLTLAGSKVTEVRKTLSSMVLVKGTIVILVFIVFLIFLKFSSYSAYTKTAILILGLSAIPISFGNFYLNSFKILDNFKKEATGNFIQVAFIIGGIALNHFYGKADAIYFAWIIALARIVYFIYAMISYNNQFRLTINSTLSEAVQLAKKATPFAIHFILSSFIIYIDTFVLSFLATMEDVGTYQAAMRIIMAAMLISIIVSDAFIPEVSSSKKNVEAVKVKMIKLFEFLILFASLAILSVYFFKSTIIQLLFSDAYLVLNSFMLYIISIIFLRYIGIVPGIILTSLDKQSVRAVAVIASVVVSILLNIILIPRLGIEGAFIASLIAHLVLNAIYMFKSYEVVPFVTSGKNYLFIISSLLLVYFIIAKFLDDNITSMVISILLSLATIIAYANFAQLKTYLKSNYKT